jgi:hypothetical protein
MVYILYLSLLGLPSFASGKDPNQKTAEMHAVPPHPAGNNTSRPRQKKKQETFGLLGEF